MENYSGGDDLFQSQFEHIAAAQMLRNRGVVFQGEQLGGDKVTFNKQWRGSEFDFDQLRNIAYLSHLEFIDRRIASHQLKTIGQLSNLQSIAFRNCDFPNDSFTTIALPESLRWFMLTNATVDPPLVREWSKAEHLKVITLNACKFTRGAVELLPRLNRISTIGLANMKLDEPFLEKLAALEALEFVELTSCKFEFDDYRELSSAMRTRNGIVQLVPSAFLGVRAADPFNNQPTTPCQVSEVIPDSGAAKAGVQVGDIIETVDGHAVEAFEDLRAHIAMHDPGEKLQLRVNRDGEQLTIEVELGDYKDSPVR
jgi:hypothetical protein